MLPLLMNTGTVHDQKEGNSERNGLMLCAKNTEHGLKTPHFPSISSYISNKMEKANIAFHHSLVTKQAFCLWYAPLDTEISNIPL